MNPAQALNVTNAIAKGTQNASAMALANQQGQNISPFDVMGHTVDGLSSRMQDAINDPKSFLLGDPEQQARVDAAMMPGQWQSSSVDQWIDSAIAQQNALKDQFNAIGDAKGALPTIGATFAFLTSIEQMISTMLSIIPFPAFPAVRITDMDIGLPHAHSHPPNLTPPNPVPIMLPSTGPLIPIPLFSGASQTLINNMPAARCGDMGLGIWCGGYFPMYEVFLGSSNVWIEGARAARIAIDITKHCIFTVPRPSDPPLGPMIGTTITSSMNVLIGGIPMPSLLGLAMGAAFKGMGKLLGKGAKTFGRVTAPLRKKLGTRLPSGLLKCNILRAEPVNVVTGEVVVDQQDYSILGRIPIEWNRHYGSQSSYVGVCGYGWESPADIRLEQDDEGIVILHRGAEGVAVFETLPQANESVMELVNGAVLSRQQDYLVVQLKEGITYSFRISKKPTNELLIESIADLHGNSLTFVRDEHGLKKIIESAGRHIEVTSHNGQIQAMQLHHPEKKNLRPLVRYEYDPDTQDLLTVYDVLDQPYSFRYHHHCLAQHTDRNGLTFYYRYDEYSSEGRCIRTWGDDELYHYQLAFDVVLNQVKITNSLGFASTLQLDEFNLPAWEIDALGGMTRYEYDAANRNSVVIDPDGNRTEYEHDERGNLVKLIRPDGVSIQAHFNMANQTIRITDPNGGIWKQIWSERNQLTAQISPLGAKSVYQYDTQGQMTGFTNPLGAQTTLKYNALGHLSQITDALSHTTTYDYDALGNVITEIDPHGHRTHYEYDAKGRLKKVTFPSGTAIICSYDSENNLTRYIDENGAETRFEYFGQGEIKRRIQPDGHVVEYHYDTEENLIGVTNQRGENYALELDALGRIVAETDYWGQVRRYAYTAAGFLKESINPLGRIIRYDTDSLGRVVNKSLPHPEDPKVILTESFSYDANGNLIGCENATIKIERKFDADDHLIEEKQGDDCLVSNTYDLNGNRLQRAIILNVSEDPLTHTVHYRYDKLDQLVSIEAESHAPIAMTRDAYGQIAQESLSLRLDREYAYDQDGYLIAQQVNIGQSVLVQQNYRYDRAGNLVGKKDSVLGNDQYAYDPMGRLIEHLDPQAKLQHYLNDPTGDRLPTHIEQSSTHNGSVDGWFREGVHDGVRYKFDRAGNLIEQSNEQHQIHFVWDANQRLVQSSTNGQITTYSYDPLGRRFSKASDHVKTLFQWDQNALLGDCTRPKTGMTASFRQWIYYTATFEPLALVHHQVNGQNELEQNLYLYHNDPNGCPMRILDQNGLIVWAAQHSVWGKVERLHAHQVDNPIRLQGQYEDQETCLHYNRYRYYNADVGQFISQDPIGLQGGLQLYAYAPNSLSWIDPLGLLCKYLRKRLRRIEELVQTPGDKGIPTALTPRELRKLGEEFVGEGYTITRGSRHGELWLISKDQKRMFRAPTPKASDYARTGKQANFHQRTNTNQDWFKDKAAVSNVHVHAK